MIIDFTKVEWNNWFNWEQEIEETGYNGTQ